MSGFLALLVGLSLLYQWMNSDLTRAEKGIAWFSTMVGLCTIVSGLAPKLETTAQAPASMAYVSGVTGILTSALVGILGLVLVIGGWRKESWPTGPSVGIGVLLLLSLIGTIWFAVASFNPPSTTDSDAFAPYTLAGNIVGMVAVGSWMLAELLNTWPLTKDYLRAPNANVSLDDFTGWEKSVFEIVGALITLVYLVLVTANSNFQTELSKAFFHYGAALAAVGTIKAMIRGIFRQRAKMGQ